MSGPVPDVVLRNGGFTNSKSRISQLRHFQGLWKRSVTMREITTKFSKGLFIPQEGLHVKEGKEVVVAITDGACSDGAVTGLR